MVRNGYHRIAALTAAGHDEIPAVIIEASKLAAIVPPEAVFWNAGYLQSLGRPPLVVDFLSPSVTLEIPHAAHRRLIEIRLDIAELQLPV